MLKKRLLRKKNKPADLAKDISSKAIELQSSSSKHLKKYVAKRGSRIHAVRRFTIGWLVLAFGLCVTSTYAAWNLHAKSKTDAADSGGTYVEGMTGEINNLNPLFSNGTIDGAASKLIFNGLLRYSEQEEYVADLAESWKVGKDNKTYTVTLRKDVLWHDGEPFTSRDVLYTIKTIQTPAARSPFYSSWQGVAVSAKGDYQVTFELSSPFAPFVDALTVPILPAHILEDVEPDNLRTATFSNVPIGTGPFKMQILRTTNKGQQLELETNKEYFKNLPRVDRFVLAAYAEEGDLLEDLKNREITSAVDLSSEAVSSLSENTRVRTAQFPLNNGVFAFFKTSNKPLNDASLRNALVLATDRAPFLDIFQTRYQPLKSAILPNQLGYSSSYNQKTNLKAAARALDKAGWKLKDGVRKKGSQSLEFNLVTVDSAEYSKVASELQRQWKEVGIVLKPRLLNQEQLEQTALSAHDYDILLYGISIGSDPDVYAYWHSSQAQPGGLNFSEWKSDRADLNLEVGRTRLDPVLRRARYEDFSDEWQKSAPAVALYRPRLSYSYHQNAQGFSIFSLNTSPNRLTNVEDWTAATRSVTLTP